MDWFYAKNNQQLGPVTLEALSAMLHRGELLPGDLVWRDGMPNWLAASSTPELVMAVPGGSSIGYYNPVAASAASAAMASQAEYAGFWLRFVAYLIDSILLGVVGFIVNFFIGLAFGAFHPALNPRGNPFNLLFVSFFSIQSMVGMAINWLYFAYLESSKYQATLGKLALGLIVTDLQGQRINFGRATGRYFGKILSAFTIYIGFMMAGWTERKQALHDIIASTLVIRRP